MKNIVTQALITMGYRKVENNVFMKPIGYAILIAKLLDSALIQELLLTRTATYFLDNPEEAQKVIESSEVLAPLLKEEKLKAVLLNNPITHDFATVVFPQTDQAK